MIPRRLFFIMLYSFTMLDCIGQTAKVFRVTSPDRSTSMEVKTEKGKLRYRVLVAGESITNWSPLGLQANHMLSTDEVVIRQSTQRNNKEKFAWPLGEDD